MDKFHKLLELVDKNSDNIPEGDYVNICKLIKEIHDRVKPPSFLLNYNEPMTMPRYEPTTGMGEEELGSLRRFIEELDADWAATDNDSGTSNTQTDTVHTELPNGTMTVETQFNFIPIIPQSDEYYHPYYSNM
tara:strand:+ start:191 stop:589 length:399 start_codon:yes stop_codon:yes gene_type:complete